MKQPSNVYAIFFPFPINKAKIVIIKQTVPATVNVVGVPKDTAA
jgi:hypothetical protein